MADGPRASGEAPDLTAPNMAAPGGPPPGFFDAYGEWMMSTRPTWNDIAWVRERWDGPLMVNGITYPDDARAAADAGAFNHGGNNLDGTPATIRALPGVVAAVGDRVQVLVYGGVRRGSDVVKALALGARGDDRPRAAVGLAANGEAGVANVLEILRAGIDETLVGLGKSSIDELSPDHLVVPEGFTRRPADRPGQDAPDAAREVVGRRSGR